MDPQPSLLKFTHQIAEIREDVGDFILEEGSVHIWSLVDQKLFRAAPRQPLEDMEDPLHAPTSSS
jgi:hypothetical protein